MGIFDIIQAESPYVSQGTLTINETSMVIEYENAEGAVITVHYVPRELDTAD